MTPVQKAIIYCRVSDKKQKHDGDGLQSQEHRCRDYAAGRGYAVEAVFHDDVSGGGDFMKRPGMVAMLRFMESRAHNGYVVIFDDLKRFARDTIFHLKLRQELATCNATVECLNFKFEDTPEGQFVETVIAAQGQLERLQNRRQTLQKMKARVERGYYVFACPVGYHYEKVGSHGRMLVKHEPLASLIQEALEGYASGRFETQAEVKRFLESHAEYPRDRGGELRAQRVTNLLTRPVYTGYVEAPKWGVSLRKGHHEALISFETFQRIQDRISGNAKAPARKNLLQDFPLRGFVTCGDCATPLTACWARGCRNRYAYYFCPKRGCESYGKSVRRELTRSRRNWKKPSAASSNSSIGSRTRNCHPSLPPTKTASENWKNGKIANCGRPLRSFDDTLRTALDFLENPVKLWTSPRLEHKRAVLKLAFTERLAYQRKKGFRTPAPALPFKVLADFKRQKSKMARPEGESWNPLLDALTEWSACLDTLSAFSRGAVGVAISD